MRAQFTKRYTGLCHTMCNKVRRPSLCFHLTLWHWSIFAQGNRSDAHCSLSSCVIVSNICCLTSFLAGTSLTHNISVASLLHLYQDNEKISPHLRPRKDWPCRPCHVAGVDEEGQQGSNSQDLGLRSVFYATEVQGRCLKGILNPATYRLQTCESVPWFHEDILLPTTWNHLFPHWRPANTTVLVKWDASQFPPALVYCYKSLLNELLRLLALLQMLLRLRKVKHLELFEAAGCLEK